MKIPVFAQADPIQGRRDLAVHHEPAPDGGGAHVFGAQENDADVDADDVSVGPAGLWVEGIDEAVATVDFGAIPIVHGGEGARGEFGGEH